MSETATTVIADDHACIHCGYNLRGLSPDGKCPECFTQVGQSLRGDLLKFADPDWLDRLRFGTSLKLWNIVLLLVVGIGAAVLMFLGFPPSVQIFLGMVGGAAGLWASFVITTQEPSIALREDPVTWRKAIRTCAVIAFLGSALEQFGQRAPLGEVLIVLAGAFSLAGLVSMFGELLYFRRFALRIPDAKLARGTKVVMWGSVTCAGLLAIMGTVAAIFFLAPVAAGTVTPAGGAVSTSMGVSGFLLGGIFCGAVVPGAVFFVWYVILLVRYRRAFTAAAAEARHAIPPT